MTTLIITTEVIPGSNIEMALIEAVRLAKLLNVGVQFNFNGVMCYINSTSNVSIGVDCYHDALKNNHKYITC